MHSILLARNGVQVNVIDKWAETVIMSQLNCDCREWPATGHQSMVANKWFGFSCIYESSATTSHESKDNTCIEHEFSVLEASCIHNSNKISNFTWMCLAASAGRTHRFRFWQLEMGAFLRFLATERKLVTSCTAGTLNSWTHLFCWPFSLTYIYRPDRAMAPLATCIIIAYLFDISRLPIK